MAKVQAHRRISVGLWNCVELRSSLANIGSGGTQVAEELSPLNLGELGAGMPGLTDACGTLLAESAAVCFADRSHSPGVVLGVYCPETKNFAVHWQAVTDQQRRCYNDLQWATEMGAYGVAILVVNAVSGKKVIERSKKGTGFDYWIGDTDESELIFSNKARLEVSGILHGSDGEVAARLKQKNAQIRASDSLGMTAYIAVVEFSHPKARLEMK
jgi:hypothetical protein